jgi:catechol 2,3-dioxygenase-like lactoylglutathione lyase family enzyme
MLERSEFVATLPAQDIERAKTWYREKLGLEPVEEHEGALIYRAGSGTFQLYPTQVAGIAQHTLGCWYVDDLEATVAELRGRGVEFEEYDFPGLKTEDGIAELGFERSAWFKDCEGNTVAVAQLARS